MLTLLLSTPPIAQPAGYGELSVPEVGSPCLRSGERVAGLGRKQYCIDVAGATLDDAQKLVLSVSTPRPVETVRLGNTQLVRGFRSQNHSAAAPVIEVKPFQQGCVDQCGVCGCIGCGERCGCSCNVQCRLGGGRSCSGDACSCGHTAGVLMPGRWYIGVDAAGSFTLQAWLVAALPLRTGAKVRRGLVPLEAQTQAGAAVSTSSEGAAWSDYFYLDAPPHEAVTLQVDLMRSGAPAGWVDVYLRFGAWPTTLEYDASMSTNPAMTIVSPQFVLQAGRLLNERLYVMVLAQGGSPVEYSLNVGAHANLPLLLACVAMFALGVGVLVLVVRRWLRHADYKDIPG